MKDRNNNDRDDEQQSMNWMYTNPEDLKRENNLDEYLLGHKKVSQLISEKHEDDYDRIKKQQMPGANFLQQQQAPIGASRDVLSQIKKDPMTAVKASQLAQLKQVLEREKLKKAIEQKEKEKKKQRKKEKKEKELLNSKKRKRHERGSESETESDKEYKRRKRERKREEKDERTRERKERKEDKYSRRKRHYDDDDDSYYRRDNSRNCSSSSSSSSSYSRMSEEERKRALETMMQDGQANQQNRLQDLHTRQKEKKLEHEALRDTNQDATNAQFLNKVKSQAYLDSGHTLQERIGRNINRIGRVANPEE